MKIREQDEEELRKLREEIEVLKLSPSIRKAKEDEASKVLICRTLARHEADRLQKELEEYILKRSEIDELIARLKKLDDERRDLQAAISEKQASFVRERLDIEGEIKQQQEILFSTYDLKIDEGIQFFRDKYDALRRKKADKQTYAGETNIFTLTKELTTFSNVAAIRSALAYCLNAIRALEAMRLEPALDVDLIEALKRGIFDTGEMTEITSEKPLPRVNTAPPLKSDSQLTWELSKLNEKFKKVMGRLI